MNSQQPPTDDQSYGDDLDRLVPGKLREGFSFFTRTERQASKPARGLEPGKVVGDFRLTDMIGEGGMGQVWEAEQISLGGRRVAVKFIRPGHVTPRQLDYFAREARAGGRISHDGIVRVYGYGESDELTWIAMEYVEGAWTLKNFLDELRGQVSAPPDYYVKVARLVAKIADGLQAAHEAGVIHRDVKPQNILIAPDDTPKVTDFGLARVANDAFQSVTGDIGGTWFYMSPEQVMARRMGLDHRSDIFSLGVVLYELLALQRPFDGDSTHEIAHKIITHDPPDPSTVRQQCPRELAIISGKALEKNPDRRYQSMAELAADLRHHLAHEPISARPPGRAQRIAKWVRRNPTMSSAGAVALLALLILTGMLTLLEWQPKPSPRATLVSPLSPAEGDEVVLGLESSRHWGFQPEPKWTQTLGRPVTLDLSNPELPSFTAPSTGQPYSLEFEATLSYPQGTASTRVTVRIRTKNVKAPRKSDGERLSAAHAVFFATSRSVQQQAYVARFPSEIEFLAKEQACEACHTPNSAETTDERCFQCHEVMEVLHPDGSNQLGCGDCHREHSDNDLFPSLDATIDSCERCHLDTPWEGAADRYSEPADLSRVIAFDVEYTGFWHSDHLTEGKVIQCVACHKDAPASDDWSSPSAGREFAVVEYETCVTCHASDAATRTAEVAYHSETLQIPNEWHGAEGEGSLCLDCHSGIYEADMRRTRTKDLFARFSFAMPSTPHVDDAVHRFPAGSMETCEQCHWNPATLQGTSADEPFLHGLHMSTLTPSVDERVRISGTTVSSGRSGTCMGCHKELITSSDLSTETYRGATLDACQECHEGAPANAIQRIDNGTLVFSGSRVLFPHDKHLDFDAGGPLADGCFTCHEFDAPTDPENWKSHPVRVRDDIAQNCGDCHDGHTNIAQGSCAKCHTPTDRVYEGSRWNDSWDGSAGFRHYSPGHKELTNEAGCIECHSAADGTDVRIPSELERACVGCHIEDRMRMHWISPR